MPRKDDASASSANPRTGTPCIERPSTPITLLGQEPHFERLPWPCNIVTFDPRKGAGPEPSPTKTNQNQFEPKPKPFKTNQNHNHRTDRRRRRRFGRHGVWGGEPSLEKMFHFLAAFRAAPRIAVPTNSPTN